MLRNDFSSCFFFTLRDASRDSNEYLSWDLYAGDQIEAFRRALGLVATRYRQDRRTWVIAVSCQCEGLFVAILPQSSISLGGTYIARETANTNSTVHVRVDNVHPISWLENLAYDDDRSRTSN